MLPSPTWLSSKAGLSGSESLPPLLLPLLPRDKGLLWEGEPTSEGGGVNVSTSDFTPSMATSVFPPLPQADTRSFSDSAGRRNRAGDAEASKHGQFHYGQNRGQATVGYS